MKQVSIAMGLAMLLIGHAAGQAFTQLTPAAVVQMRQSLGQMNFPKTCFTLEMGSAPARRTFIKNLKPEMLSIRVNQGNAGTAGPNSDILMIAVASNLAPDVEPRVKASLLRMRSDLCQSGFSSAVFVSSDVKDFQNFHGDVVNPRVYWVGRILPQRVQFADSMPNKTPLRDAPIQDAIKFVDIVTLTP